MQQLSKRAWNRERQNWHSGERDSDGYRLYLLPPAGSDLAPTSTVVNEICDDWFVEQSEFVRGLMRRIAGHNTDAIDRAWAATALAYFQSVRNGNGIARYVRLHLTGTFPIREPKGLFIRTIELHRSAALREMRAAQTRSIREIPLAPWALSVIDKQTTYHPERFVNHLLDVRRQLLQLSAESCPDPVLITTLLDKLEQMCSDAVRFSGLLSGRTARQRLVFLLRIDPLSDVAELALEYDRIAALAAALAIPSNADALRQSVRELRQSLRSVHGELADLLRN